MTLTMGDGPPENIPPGLSAVAGYVNKSGIGITYPQVVAKFPNAYHLSITTNGSPAMCADVETGAMSNWTGYSYGYCSVNRVNSLIASYGRPARLWTAHYDPAIGAHICSPACWPGLVTTADGTQWVDHGGWDESLLKDDFFDLSPIPIPPTEEYEVTDSVVLSNGTVVSHAVTPSGHYLEIIRQPWPGGQAPSPTTANMQIFDITDAFNGFPIVAP
jgi:hypothetical protein